MSPWISEKESQGSSNNEKTNPRGMICILEQGSFFSFFFCFLVPHCLPASGWRAVPIPWNFLLPQFCSRVLVLSRHKVLHNSELLLSHTLGLAFQMKLFFTLKALLFLSLHCFGSMLVQLSKLVSYELYRILGSKEKKQQRSVSKSNSSSEEKKDKRAHFNYQSPNILISFCPHLSEI